MTKLTYKIVTNKGTVLKSGVETYAEAKKLADALHAQHVPEYTYFEPEKPKFDRSKCKKSEAWLAEHSN